MTTAGVFSRIRVAIDAMLSDVAGPTAGGGTVPAGVRYRAAELAWEDLCALAHRDAAAAGDPEYVLDSYASYHAVLTYRVAHSILHISGASSAWRAAARRLSENAKVRTGVEIHPAALIGRRFIVDHGLGTVIGEQTEVGDDCYVLQAVVLGGPSIGRSSTYRQSRRHPRIGDRVEIGGGAMVLGPVTVGNDCRLGPGVRVTSDVPDGARVRLVTTTQVSLTLRPVEVHRIAVVAGDLLVTGTGLAGLTPALLNEKRMVVSYLPVTKANDRSILCGRPAVWTPEARFVGLFEKTGLACYVGGGNSLACL
jgi:serine O-acetyltransferase